MNFWLIPMLSIALVLTACGSENDASRQSNTESDSGADTDSVWVAQHSTDPLNDARLSTATAELDASGYTAKTTITCINEAIARFKFEFTDTFGNPVPLKFGISQRPFGGGPVETVSVAARVDDDPPFLMQITNIGVNSLAFESSTPGKFASRFRENKLITANMLLLRFPIADNKTVDVYIDMADPNLMEATAPCAKKMKAAFGLVAEPIDNDTAAKNLGKVTEVLAVGHDAFKDGARDGKAYAEREASKLEEKKRRTEEFVARSEAEARQQDALDAQRRRRELEEYEESAKLYLNEGAED